MGGWHGANQTKLDGWMANRGGARRRRGMTRGPPAARRRRVRNVVRRGEAVYDHIKTKNLVTGSATHETHNTTTTLCGKERFRHRVAVAARLGTR